MSREYFKGIEELYEYNAIVDFEEVRKKLYIPRDFRKCLCSSELHALLDDQLREKGLTTAEISMYGCSRVVEKNKHAKPIEKRGANVNSKRLWEYLEKFHADEAAGLI